MDLISSLTKGLKDRFGHVPDLQRSSHACNVACTMHAAELTPHVPRLAAHTTEDEN
jgi:hypothetical protein